MVDFLEIDTNVTLQKRMLNDPFVEQITDFKPHATSHVPGAI